MLRIVVSIAMAALSKAITASLLLDRPSRRFERIKKPSVASKFLMSFQPIICTLTHREAIANHRDLIVGLANRYRLPAVYASRNYVDAGGLMSYGVDLTDNYLRAASYVDRLFKGEKPADLPVQQPIKFKFLLNLKTAKTLGFEVPPAILVRADEVIE